MKNVAFYSIKLVKEKTSRYDIVAIKNPQTVYDSIMKIINLEEKDVENLILVALNTKNYINGVFTVSIGSMNSSIVDVRSIFKDALLCNANSIILAHNHPSGDSTPSDEDIDITKRVEECGKILNINLLDHMIIGHGGKYTSLREKGIMS
jgi:DNA repair protein RadC